MKHLVELALENLSTKDYFLFRVLCEACGMVYGSKTVRFSKADAPPQTGSRKLLYEALYEQEFKCAQAVAIREAAEQLNYCPICKRLVCNRCFLICEELDMCAACAEMLEEAGVPVMPEALEIAI